MTKIFSDKPMTVKQLKELVSSIPEELDERSVYLEIEENGFLTCAPMLGANAQWVYEEFAYALHLNGSIISGDTKTELETKGYAIISEGTEFSNWIKDKN